MDLESTISELNNGKTEHITQEDIDNMLKICVKDHLKEEAWRVSLAFGCYKSFDFMNYVKFFIDEKDAYYLSELVYTVWDINVKKVYKLVCKTKDEEFINDFVDYMKTYLDVKTREDVIKELSN